MKMKWFNRVCLAVMLLLVCSTPMKSRAVGNTIGTATSIALEQKYADEITEASEWDFYKFTIPQSGWVSLEQSCYIEYGDDAYWQLYDQKGNKLATTSVDYDANRGYAYDDGGYYLMAGTYYLLRYEYWGGYGKYEFTLHYQSAKESFPESQTARNDVVSQAKDIKLGVRYKGQLGVDDDQDFYRFEVPFKTKIAISHRNYAKDADWELFNSRVESLHRFYADYDANKGYCEDVDEYELEKGIYYLKAYKYYYGTDGDGFYDFKVSVNHKHSYQKTVKKATPKANGSITQKCRCGKKNTSVIYYPKKITLSADCFTYDGKAKSVSVTVKDSSGKKLAASNYSVEYKTNRKLVGTHKITIKFKKNYSGSVSRTFTIRPRGTSITGLTAKTKGFGVTLKRQTAQVTGYEVQYAPNSSFKNASVKKIRSSAVTTANVTRLKGGQKYYVRVRTYKTVGGKNYYSKWSAAKTVRTKKSVNP